jgi:hypothetical protein
MRPHETAVGPLLQRFRGGWSASADGFATFASTKEEALRQFWLHRPAPVCTCEGCELQAVVVLEDVPLCHQHYEAVTSEAASAREVREDVGVGTAGRSLIWLNQGTSNRPPPFGS